MSNVMNFLLAKKDEQMEKVTTEQIQEKIVPRLTMLEIARETRDILQIIEDAGGEISPALEERLGVNDASFSLKVDSTCYVLRKMESEVEFWKEQRDEIVKKIRSYENNIKRIEDRIKFIGTNYGIKSFKGSLFTASLRAGAIKLAIDEDKLPAEYLKEVKSFEVDKEAIKSDIELGFIPAGVEEIPVVALTIRFKGGEK